jgi:hypothetical protein
MRLRPWRKKTTAGTLFRSGLALALALNLAACAGMERAQGLAQTPAGDSVFASGSLPSLVVIPAEGFRSAAAGNLFVGVSQDGFLPAYFPVRVCFALFTTGPRQLAVYLADAPHSLEWAPNPAFTERRGLPVLEHAMADHDGFEMETLTYVRPRGKDPWMPVYAAQGPAWNGDVLVRQRTWLTLGNSVKLVVEYREAAPALAGPREIPPDFEERAAAAFRLLGSRQAEAFPFAVERNREEKAAGISAGLLSAVLGEIRPKTVIWERE